MKLQSSAFEQGKEIPKKYSCQGENTNPPLEISAVPKGTVSLALIVEDPDVPAYIRKDKLYVHWVVYNIDPATKTIPEGAKTFATQGKHTGGKNGYTGPCPPDKRHRYFFKLYALDTKLDLKEGATKEELLKAMEGHILNQTELMGTYEQT